MGWTEQGQYPPGGLSRGGTTSAPDKSAWVGSRSLLKQGAGVLVIARGFSAPGTGGSGAD